jgi:DNA helicase-2/ATP-dependent DNA helicase PcrA
MAQGARLRVFADPMQKIFSKKSGPGSCPPWEWDELKTKAHAFEELDFPHRWVKGCPDLGKWTLAARNALKNGGKVDLRSGLPPSVTIVFAENQAQKNLEYQLGKHDRKPVDAFAFRSGKGTHAPVSKDLWTP